MLHFLDIIMSPEDWGRLEDWERVNIQRRRGRAEFRVPDFFQKAKPDTVFSDSVFNVQSTPDSASVDTLMNNGVADTISNRNGVIDTLHASGSFLNGPAAGNDQTTLIWTALAVIAALALCFCFIRLFRKRCCAIESSNV